jgi:hypothetical protein
MHHLTPLVCFVSQQIKLDDHHPKLVSAQGHSGRISSSL